MSYGLPAIARPEISCQRATKSGAQRRTLDGIIEIHYTLDRLIPFSLSYEKKKRSLKTVGKTFQAPLITNRGVQMTKLECRQPFCILYTSSQFEAFYRYTNKAYSVYTN